jgi:hypothetical protein
LATTRARLVVVDKEATHEGKNKVINALKQVLQALLQTKLNTLKNSSEIR